MGSEVLEVIDLPETRVRTRTRPSVCGKFLWLGDHKLYLKGVTYGPFHPTEDGSEYHTPEIVRKDFALMASAGINTVRVYTVPPRWLLDLAGEHALLVLAGIPWEQDITFLDDPGRVADMERRVRDGVRTLAGRPALLGVTIGNEIPASIVRWHGRKRVERFLHRLYDAAKSEVESVFASGASGVFVFAWTDEWHCGGFDIEDWDFGITTRGRKPKPALKTIQEAFAVTPFRPEANWPFFSIVVCSYNGSRTIRDTLDHLATLDYPNFETIVISDGSTDQTAGIAREYVGVRVIETPNGGLRSARNLGWRSANGEIVAYSDDAYPDPLWLHYLAHAFIHVEDLANAHIRALEHLSGGGESMAMNLGMGRGYSVRHVIAAVERATGQAVSVWEAGRRAGDPPWLVADTSRAQQVLSWKPGYANQDAVVGTACEWHALSVGALATGAH